jgi:hypothetical protein
MSRRQASEALVMRLMSASIAATAVITAVRAAIKPRMAAERPATPSLALRGLIDERGSERARQPDPEYNGQAPDLIFQGHAQSDQLLARDDQRADGVGGQRLHVHGLKNPVRAKCASPRASLRWVLWVTSDLGA